MTGYREPDNNQCRWCGKELSQPAGRGRRRKFCSASCKQRAYEQRNNVTGTGIPKQAVIIHPDKADALRDGLYALRCAAEDISTAQAEGADATEIRELCDELVAMAKQIEKLR